MSDRIIDLQDWLQTDAGRYMLAWEQGQCRCGFAAGRGAQDGDGVGFAHAAAVAMSTGRPWL